jgi:hypothetical protein
MSTKTHTKPGTIKFTGHHSNALSTGSGTTAWSYLPAILTLASTRDCNQRIRTDADGLAKLVSLADGVEESIADAIAVIGDLLANCETEELDPGTLNNVGWLLTGLAEIRGVISQGRRDAEHQMSTGAYAVGGDHA